MMMMMMTTTRMMMTRRMGAGACACDDAEAVPGAWCGVAHLTGQHKQLKVQFRRAHGGPVEEVSQATGHLEEG
jgi:hypothetical protein